MNLVASALAASLALAAAAAMTGLTVANAWRARLTGVLMGLSGVAGAAMGGLAVTGTGWAAQLPDVLPLGGISLAADPLSGWFLLIVGAVTAATGVYTIGYAGRTGRGPSSRAAMAILPLFGAAMLLVPLAASVTTFLLTWELMAVTSLVLVMTEHRHHDAVRPAAIWYAAMTQAGFVTILIGLSWAASAAGDQSFAGIREAAASIRPFAAGTIFILCLLGFASKAGAVPLHPWLPRAHAEASSHVSALMSAAMVKLGVYGIVRLGFDLLGGGPRWWWLLVAALGALSALYGIIQAVVATDLKRLLAFSTSENIGLILLGVGFAGMLARSGQTAAGRSRWQQRCCTPRIMPGSKHCCFSAPDRCSGPPAPATSTPLAGCRGGCAPPPPWLPPERCARQHCRRATGSSPSGCCCKPSCTKLRTPEPCSPSPHRSGWPLSR